MGDFICPECGAVLKHGRHDFAAHALTHWGVGARHIDRIPNSEAQNRYRAILAAESQPDEPTETSAPAVNGITIKESDL